MPTSQTESALEVLRALVSWIDGWRDQVGGRLEERWKAGFRDSTPELVAARDVLADAAGVPGVEELRQAMYENVAKGWAEVIGETEHGEPVFRMTEQGRRHVEEMLDD